LDHSQALLAAPGAVLHSMMGNVRCVKAPADFSKKRKEAKGREKKGGKDCDKSKCPWKKEMKKNESLKARSQKVMTLLCGLFYLKSRIKNTPPIISLLKLFSLGWVSISLT
jgi:hypothetical protein